VHGHCHQKALVGMEPTRQVLSKVEGLEFTIWTADAAGWRVLSATEQGHYEVSRACGERVLFPAVRGTAADDLVVAPRLQLPPPNRRLLRQPPQLAHSGVVVDGEIERAR
jgi:hypothetical protein